MQSSRPKVAMPMLMQEVQEMLLPKVVMLMLMMLMMLEMLSNICGKIALVMAMVREVLEMKLPD